MFPYDQTITTAILETSLDAAFTISQDGTIVDVNAAASRLFGWSRGEFIGRNISCIVSGSHKVSHDDYLLGFNPARGISHILGNGQLLLAERKNGELFPVEVGISSFVLEGQRFFTGFVRDMSERQNYVERLQHVASHDDDTGLLNFRGLQAYAENQSAAEVAICLHLQLQGFSRTVAADGRQAGRQILTSVAERLQQCCAAEVKEYALARVGEAAFAVLAATDAEQLARVCLAAVSAPVSYAGMTLEVIPRIGLSEGQGAFEQRFRESMAASEHVSQQTGGILSFSSSLAQKLQRELLIESRLHHAVESNALRLVLQPKLDFQSERVIGAEALVRWQDEELGQVFPDEFIPIAERTGQIGQITDWVLAQSLAIIRSYAAQELSVAVNFSALDFQQVDVVDRVKRALEQAGVRPQQLEIELTESAVADDPAVAAQRMHALKTLGITLSLDDFGTGFSSLSSLRQFPIDTLKVDASFVRSTPDNPDACAIVAAIAALARALGLSTVAEGVETRVQADFLTAQGVDYCQGYLFSRPLTPVDFHAFVSRFLPS
jgi:PAS domain S-box-containing protein